MHALTWVSWICFGVSGGIVLSMLRPHVDPLSPGRVFALVWSLAIGLTDLKLSGLQHQWSLDSWILLLLAVCAFLTGTFIVYVLHIKSPLLPLAAMRDRLQKQEIHEGRLFWLICATIVVYAIAYALNYMLKGWLPIEAAAMNISRVDINVTGLTFLIYLVPVILFFVLLYFHKVEGRKGRKTALLVGSLIVIGSFILFVSRFQFIVVIVLSFVVLYYATRHINIRTTAIAVLAATGFFYLVSSIRLSHLVSTYLHYSSKMKTHRDYAFLTEPYMYVVMNLENFSRAVGKLDYHTFGYYTFDFITAIAGLKYWIYGYFNLERHPYLISGYNTYSSFWTIYSDFGAAGLFVVPLLLGAGIAKLYYAMRTGPTLQNVTAYGVMVFVMFISFFVPVLSWLWFEFNLAVMLVFLKLTVKPLRIAA